MTVLLLLGTPRLHVTAKGDGAVSLDIHCNNHPLDNTRLFFNRETLALFVAAVDERILHGGTSYLFDPINPQLGLEVSDGALTLTLPSWKNPKPVEGEESPIPMLVLELAAVRKLMLEIRKAGGLAFLAT